MKNMKKLAMVLALGMVLSLAGCGDKGEGSTASGSAAAPEEIKGETYETSLISVLIPDGWMAFPKSDFFEEYPDEPGDPSGLMIYKDAKDDWDQFTKPGLTIEYYTPDISLVVLKDYYNDVKDLEDMTIGGCKWQGFTATSMEKPVAVVWTTEPNQIMVTCWLQADEGSISVDDADVQAILASITVK